MGWGSRVCLGGDTEDHECFDDGDTIDTLLNFYSADSNQRALHFLLPKLPRSHPSSSRSLAAILSLYALADSFLAPFNIDTHITPNF